MSDPIRMVTGWTQMRSMSVFNKPVAGQILRQDPLQMSMRIIARNELRVWFEPNWRDGRFLARRFPHCLICSIPEESDTINLRRIPKWRPRRDMGVV